MNDDILYIVKDNMAWITINQAEKINRLTFDAMREIAKSIKIADEDREVKVLVITGAVDKAFLVTREPKWNNR